MAVITNNEKQLIIDIEDNEEIKLKETETSIIIEIQKN